MKTGSFDVGFAFSTGLSRTIVVPFGTGARLVNHVHRIEKTLGLKTTRYLENPPHWDTKNLGKGVDDKTFCETVSEHNKFVRWFKDRLSEWTTSEKPLLSSEELTPEGAAMVWHGLQLLTVPFDRWTRDYYRERMDVAYEVLRGRPTDGITFGRKLSPKTAGDVIWLFEVIMESGFDLRLEVPHGRDHLASSDDGGYDWCSCCGAVHPDDGCIRDLPKKKCPLFIDMGEDDDEENND